MPDGLSRALVLTACSPVLIAVPTFAVLLGLDAAFALIAVIATSLLQPVLQPPLALLLLGLELDISAAQLMQRLAVFVGGAFAVALVIRWLAGTERLTRLGGPISGDRRADADRLRHRRGRWRDRDVAEGAGPRPPLRAVRLHREFRLAGDRRPRVSRPRRPRERFDRRQTLTAALATGNRNLAVLVAVLGGNADSDLLLFLAVNQFPMYFVPVLLGPVYRRLLARGTDG